MEHWVILTPKSHINEVKTLILTLKKVLNDMPFKLPQPEMLVLFNYCQNIFKQNSSLYGYINIKIYDFFQY